MKKLKNWLIKKLGGFTEKQTQDMENDLAKRMHVSMSDFYNKEYSQLRKKLSKYESVPPEGNKLPYWKWLDQH